MTCRDVIDFLMAYVDGQLTAEQRAAFDQHLSICEACRDYLASYGATLRLERALDLDAAPPVPEELVRAIVAARGESPGGGV